MPPGATSGQLEAGVRVGDFEIERRLGAGGMGIVYKARQVSLDRVVALKVLGPALTRPADLERFQREARAAARLTHPGITAIHFIGQDAQVCYHVMEYVDGVPLQRVIDRLGQSDESAVSPDAVVAGELSAQAGAPVVRFDGPTDSSHAAGEPTGDATVNYVRRGKDGGRAVGLSSVSAGGKQTRRELPYIRRCCEIVRDVAGALAYAHGEGVIHRDIKPENLMLDRAGQVRVIDFGLARYFDDESITHTGQLLGTPLYMSPEQVTGRFQVDHRTDIYSLGLVLYELLALRRPFEATNRETLLRNIVTKPLPPLAGRNPAVAAELEAIIHKATAKDPEERYQSAVHFADDLELFLAGKAVSAPPYRFRLDMQEVIARRPTAVVLAAFAVIVFACVQAVVMTYQSTETLVSWFFPLEGVRDHTRYDQIVIVWAVSLMTLGVSIVIARLLLRGGSTARWVVIVGFALLSLVFLSGVIWLPVMAVQTLAEETRQWPNVDNRKSNAALQLLIAVFSLLLLACAVTPIVGLLRARSRDWFRLAKQTRQEHQELLRTLSE